MYWYQDLSWLPPLTLLGLPHLHLSTASLVLPATTKISRDSEIYIFFLILERYQSSWCSEGAV